MSTVADLPSSSYMLTGPQYAWKGNVDPSSREETFSWFCPWQDSNAFYAALVGSTTTINLGGGVTIQRQVPLQHPWNPNLFATKYGWEGKDGTNKPPGAFYKNVIFNVTFGYSAGGTGTGGGEGGGTAEGKVPLFCKISSKASTRSVTDTARQYSYTDPTSGNTVKLKHDVAVQFGGNAYEITLYMIPDIDAWQAVVAPLVGKVNKTPFNLGAFTRDKGTVLFEGYGYDVDYDVLGNQSSTATMQLHCSSLPWNNYLVGGKQVALSPQPYDLEELNVLYM